MRNWYVLMFCMNCLMTTPCESNHVAMCSKVHPRTGHEGQQGEFNLAARWGGWLTPRPGRFSPGKETRYPLYRRLCGPQGRSGRVRKISPPLEFDPRTVQPVASHCTVWTIPARRNVQFHLLNCVGLMCFLAILREHCNSAGWLRIRLYFSSCLCV
jgi:hypothetical protein